MGRLASRTCQALFGRGIPSAPVWDGAVVVEAFFVVLHGWKKTAVGEEFINVADPYYGSSTVVYGDFVTQYRSMGAWTHSYWTKA